MDLMVIGIMENDLVFLSVGDFVFVIVLVSVVVVFVLVCGYCECLCLVGVECCVELEIC